MRDLKQKAVRGAVAKTFAQGVTLVLRVASIAVLARILGPKEFGLVNMVTAVTGVLALLKDAGLSLATIQRAEITEEQVSTLFWLNLAVGAVLSAACAAIAPGLAALYQEPRVLWIAVAVAPSFLLNALGVQHGAILARQMRFTACAAIDVAAIVASAAVAVGMAAAGQGYWSLVGMTLAVPAVGSLGNWLVARWIPSRPRLGAGVGSMIRLGGAVTLNGVIVYVAFNLEKVLLGRYWGADAIGLYGRAYQLISIPTENLSAAVGPVAISGLARVQDDPVRLRSYFLKGYSLVITLTLPVTLACALLGREIVLVLLGPKWGEAAALVRLLAPTILVFGFISPMFWLLFSLGMMKRSLHLALVLAPLVVGSYAVGLPHGPRGVAFAFSAAMAAWLVPHLAWCVKGTSVSLGDLARTVRAPMLAGAAAAGAAAAFLVAAPSLPPLARLFLGGAILAGAYALVLLRGLGQMGFYRDLVRTLREARTAP